ncbi:hypothetical protein PG985_012424 [Apiospora marii]|uniref:Uncharacterized protein n=1 Tax=Apiospora marii TaxID=335849 RepID=A0ABR1RED7_9PEZI
MPTRPAPLIIFPSELLPSLANTAGTAEQPTTPAALLLTRIAQEKTYSFYGPFDAASLSASAAAFIASNSDSDAIPLATILSRFLDHAQQDCIAEAALPDRPQIAQACWLTVRMFKPSREYEVPRWHRDGRMFACSCSYLGSEDEEELQPSIQGARRQQPHSKYAVTLLGPATRVLVPSGVVDEALAADVQNRGGLDDESRSRVELAEATKGCEEYTVQRGQVIRFSWGQDDSPVHSEPDFAGEDRVFVSVLFGGEEEIRGMCRFRRVSFGVVEVRG